MRPPSQELCILLADGCDTERRDTVHALHHGLPGAREREAANQEEWERALAEGGLDVVILDDCLPWADGLERASTMSATASAI